MLALNNASDIAPVVMTERLLRLPDDMLSTYRLTAPVHRILSLQTAFVAGCCQQAQEVGCLLYTSPSPRDQRGSRMPSSA